MPHRCWRSGRPVRLWASVRTCAGETGVTGLSMGSIGIEAAQLDSPPDWFEVRNDIEAIAPVLSREV